MTRRIKMYLLLEFNEEYNWIVRRMGELNELVKEKESACANGRWKDDFWIVKKLDY